MKRLLIGLFFIPTVVFGQFDPAGGETGSKAIHRDHVSLSLWGDSVVIQRGEMQLGDTSKAVVTTGSAADGLGKADNYTVSLGDGGSATYYFENPVKDVKGPDIVIFENGFSWIGGYFLELAFVEVSSNGKDYVRFPAISMADTTKQIENLSYMECEWYHNLAGKHQAPYGTPFDLSELKDSTKVDIQNIHYIRIVDVVGSIDNSIATRDSKNQIINDPWPTNFESGGFDLDAIAIIRFVLSNNDLVQNSRLITGNLISQNSDIRFVNEVDEVVVLDMSGKILQTEYAVNQLKHFSYLPGYYTLILKKDNQTYTERICVISE